MFARIVFSPYLYDSINIHLAPSPDGLPENALERFDPQWVIGGYFWVRTDPDTDQVVGIYSDFTFERHADLLRQIAGEQLFAAAKKLYEDNQYLCTPEFSGPLPRNDVQLDDAEYASIQEYWDSTVPE